MKCVWLEFDKEGPKLYIYKENFQNELSKSVYLDKKDLFDLKLEIESAIERMATEEIKHILAKLK